MAGRLLVALTLVVTSCVWFGQSAPAEEPAADGRELFVREWIPNDPRSHGGDGLGPVFNDTSCVACHNQGGVGGAGPREKNATIITAFKHSDEHFVSPSNEGALTRLVRTLAGTSEPPKEEVKQDPKEVEARRQREIKEERERLAKIHPGFKTARSVVLHHFGTGKDYATWRTQFIPMGIAFDIVDARAGIIDTEIVEAKPEGTASERSKEAERRVQARKELQRLASEIQFGGGQFFGPASVGGFAFVRGERNAIALFGSGKIDSIPEEALKELAAKKHEDFPEITGRVAMLKDGRVGRFGWKGQKASLNDFVLTACAVELGLHVPGEPQAGIPQEPAYEAPGLDLNKKELTALVSYIANLPAPAEKKPALVEQEKFIGAGKELFVSIGCAACHTQDVGDVKGLYSDLLLHDMGPDLSDQGNYGSFAPNATEDEELSEPIPPLVHHHPGHIHGDAKEAVKKDLIGALRQEWRTPPLWGLRDSAPYLHDGRAATLEQAIALHGGESTKVARNYFALSHDERQRVQAFLRSLTAPQQ